MTRCQNVELVPSKTDFLAPTDVLGAVLSSAEKAGVGKRPFHYSHLHSLSFLVTMDRQAT